MKQILLCILFITNSLIAIGQLTLRVTSIPFNTPVADKIYVVGNFNNWNPADTSKILQRQNDGSYQITFTPNASNLEYKFTRGSWSTVEGDANGQFRPNRTLIWNGNVQNEALTIQSWEGMGQNSTAAATLVNDVNRMTTLLRNAGFTTEEVKSVVKSDGAHAEWFWAREFSAGYEWLFRQSNAVSEARWKDQIRFIPNPTNSILRIETNENLNDINIEIYNIVGQLIVSRPLNANYAIDVNHLKPNSYVIKGRRGGELLFVKQFVKQ